MESAGSSGTNTVSWRRWLRQSVTYCRQRICAIATGVALVGIISELGGIWHDVHQMRDEQVKNALYALPKERRDALRGTAASRKRESTVFVDGEVSIDGSVELDQPVEVEISH